MRIHLSNPDPSLSDVNTRLARLERVAALMPDVAQSTRTALRVLGDMAEAVDGLAAEMGALRQRIADTEALFRETRDQILEGGHTLKIHLASIGERLATLEDEL